MSGNKITQDKVRREINTGMWIAIIVGFFGCIAGVVRYLSGKPLIGINARTLLPYIENGLTIAIVCFILFIAGLYNLINKKRLIKKELDRKQKEEEEFVYNRRKTQGYNVKRKRNKRPQQDKSNLKS